jgi:hypothetical protein
MHFAMLTTNHALLFTDGASIAHTDNLLLKGGKLTDVEGGREKIVLFLDLAFSSFSIHLYIPSLCVVRCTLQTSRSFETINFTRAQSMYTLI